MNFAARVSQTCSFATISMLSLGEVYTLNMPRTEQGALKT